MSPLRRFPPATQARVGTVQTGNEFPTNREDLVNRVGVSPPCHRDESPGWDVEIQHENLGSVHDGAVLGKPIARICLPASPVSSSVCPLLVPDPTDLPWGLPQASPPATPSGFHPSCLGQPATPSAHILSHGDLKQVCLWPWHLLENTSNSFASGAPAGPIGLVETVYVVPPHRVSSPLPSAASWSGGSRPAPHSPSVPGIRLPLPLLPLPGPYTATLTPDCRPSQLASL